MPNSSARVFSKGENPRWERKIPLPVESLKRVLPSPKEKIRHCLVSDFCFLVVSRFCEAEFDIVRTRVEVVLVRWIEFVVSEVH
jgi:hypothetical protein